MKLLFCSLLLITSSAWGITNRLDFSWDRGYPKSEVQAGGSSERPGTRGTAWSLDALHNVTNQLYLGIGNSHFSSGDNLSPTFLPGISTTMSSKVTSILVLGRLDLSAGSNLVPYAIAGVGWVRNSLAITSSSEALMDDAVNTIGYAAGAGVDFFLSDRWSIGFEARYQGSEKRSFDFTPAGTAATGLTSLQTPMTFYTLGLKLGIRY